METHENFRNIDKFFQKGFSECRLKTGQRRWEHIRKLDSDRWQASFVRPDLRRYNGPVTFDSKVMAEGWLSRERELIQLAAYNGARWISPVERRAKAAVVGQTVSDYAKRCIEGRNVAPRTRKLYTDSFAHHIAPILGEIGISSLSTDEANRWHSKTLVDKPTARAHAYGLLHAVCVSVVEDELLVKNPCQIKRAMSTNRKREPVLLSVAELAAVADAIRPERYRALVLLSAWGAVCFGEVTELRRKDFSEDCSVVTVSRSVTHHGECVVKTPKSAKTRTVVLPPHIRADVKHHLDTFVGPDPESLLFPAGSRSRCGHLSQNVFREALVLACKAIGREGVTHHALRHFGATMAARAGGTVAEVQVRLGHSTVRAAMAYQHSEATRQTDIADAPSRLAKPPKLAVVADESANKSSESA